MDYWNTMRKARVVLLLLVVLAAYSSRSVGQTHNTESPYSRYGIGEQIPDGSAKSFSMGGITQGLRNAHIINTANPASYTAQDSLSFIFDIGLTGQYSLYSGSGATKRSGAANVHHIALQFPVGKYFGMAAGFRPSSQVGYNVTRYETDRQILSRVGRVRYQHIGHGGTNLAFVGLACNPVKWFSLGVNAQYVFGSINRSQEMFVPHHPQYAELSYDSRLVVKGFGLSAGFQGLIPLDSEDESRTLCLGFTVETFPALGGEHRYELSYDYLNSTRYLSQNAIWADGAISVPIRYAFGGLYKNRKWEAGLEAFYQDWESYQSLGKKGALAKSYGVNLGAEFTPNAQSQRYYIARINYRFGAYYHQDPVELNGTRIQSYGLTFGLGFPYGRVGTMFHVGGKLGIQGTTSHGLVRQSFAAIVLGMSLNDIWFYKRRYN